MPNVICLFVFAFFFNEILYSLPGCLLDQCSNISSFGAEGKSPLGVLVHCVYTKLQLQLLKYLEFGMESDVVPWQFAIAP